MALTKVSGGILDPGINVAGIVTATGFDGPFTGGSGSNITAGILTATELDVNGNGDISGNLVVGGNLTANGDFTTLNTTLREVELLRVDANSSEPAGIITQRGSGNILEFFDTSANVGALTDDGNLGLGANLTSPNVKLHVKSTATGGGNIAYFDDTGSGVTGRLMILTTGGTSTDGVKLQTVNRKFTHFGSGTTTLTIDNNNRRVGIGTGTPDSKLNLVGTGSDADTRISIKDGTGIANVVGRYGSLTFQADVDGAVSGSLINFAIDGSEKVRITSDGFVGIGVTNPEDYDSSAKNLVVGSTGQEGITIRSSSPNTGNLLFNDGLNLIAGLSFKHDSTAADRYFSFSINNGSSYVEQLRLQDGKLIFSNDQNSYISGGSDVFRFTTGGTERVRINASGNVKLPDNAQLQFGGALYSGDGDLRIYHNIVANTTSPANHLYANSNYIDSHGSGNLFIRTAGSVGTYIGNTSGEHAASFHANGSAVLYWDANERFRTTTDGISVTGDIGSASAEIGDVYIADDKQVQLGNSQDFKIYHSSSDNNSYITESGSADLLIQATQIKLQDASGTDYLRGFTGGAVYLHNAGNNKFETTSTGVLVTGEVAASQDYPDLRPRLDFNFAAEKKLDPRIVYYRTGPASFTDKLGKVVLVGGNAPRFDHDPLTGESKGLLMEVTRTNLLSHSIPNSNWNLTNSTITENAAIAPDGTNTATLHLDNTTNDQHLLYTTATVSNATNYVITSYLKQPSSNSRRYYSMTIHGLGYVVFDVQNGTVHSSSGTGIQGATSTAVGNGWYRVMAHYVTTSTTGNIYWLPLADNGTSVVYAGTSTAQGMLVWGCQLEQATYETSYIPTNGSTATRGNEHAVIDGEDFTDFYNPLESSVLAVGTMQRPAASQGQLNIFHVGDNNEDGHGVFREHGTKDVWYHIRNNNSTPSGGNLNPSGFGDWDAGEEARIAIAFKDGDQAISVNGGNQITATVTSSYPTDDITKMWIGSHGNGSYFEGHIKRIAYYPKLLTDNQLNTLTA